MSYILIIAGLILIYFSKGNSRMHFNSPKEINEDNSTEFASVLNKELNNEELIFLKNKYDVLSERIFNLENTIILLNNKLQSLEIADKSNTMLTESESNDMQTIINNNFAADMNSLIFKMKDDGKDLDEICSSLKLGKGEVLLRLGLRK